MSDFNSVVNAFIDFINGIWTVMSSHWLFLAFLFLPVLSLIVSLLNITKGE